MNRGRDTSITFTDKLGICSYTVKTMETFILLILSFVHWAITLGSEIIEGSNLEFMLKVVLDTLMQLCVNTDNAH